MPGQTFTNPPPVSGSPIGGSAIVPARLVFRGDGTLNASFPQGRAVAGGGGLMIDGVLSDAAVESAMASAVMAGQSAEAVKTRVCEAIREALLDAITGLCADWRRAELLPAPVLAGSGVLRSQFIVRPTTLVLLHDACGTSGVSASATNSNIQVSAGTPLDKLTVTIANQTLLACLLGPTLAAPAPITGVPVSLSVPGVPGVTPFALPARGFVAEHPLLFVGRTPLTTPGTLLPSPFEALVQSTTLTHMLAGLDETGLRVVLGYEVSGVLDAFTIRGTAEQTYSISVTQGNGGSIVINSTPSGAPRLVTDVEIAPYLYAYAVMLALAAVSGGSIGATILTLSLIAFLAGADEGGGASLNGRLGRALAAVFGGMTPPAVVVQRPVPTFSPTVRLTSTSQPGSRIRTVAIPLGNGATWPFVDPIPSNDLIIHIG